MSAQFPAHLDLEEEEDLEVFSKNTSLTDGGPSSPSSMMNQYREEEEEELFITVDHPESHVTAIETFITYRVMTKTSRSDFDCSEFEVRRRYQDFLWLRSTLEENHPTLIVHKFVMKGMVERFNDDFIETRRRALQRFLDKIRDHPLLRGSPSLKVFLTAQDLAPHRKQTPSLLSRWGGTVKMLSQSLRGVRSRPEEFSLMQDYVEQLSSKICSVDKICSSETQSCTQHLSSVLIPVLHDYLLCADTLKAVMKRRDNIQAEYEAKREAMERRGDQEQQEEEVQALQEKVEVCNSSLQEDWSRWRSSMRTDLKTALLSTAENNMQHYEKCLAVWETFLLSQREEGSEQKEEDAP
ncbi:Sorting nexin-7 [Dissostichus eleginoides]|uniref:Sorting nexin-7 n=2 Tax=Dissostichus eleginoides TaxID=100907 RepID=A0AAD9BLN3_DISEL|nr:Sorting nexin-7 [Dissostichus eleginoides]